MNKHRQVLWAKMMLGGLTVADIRKYMGSEISFGSHWLNSVAMKKKKNDLGVSFWNRSVWPLPDISLPMEAVVKVKGDIARLKLEKKRIANSSNMPDFVEVRIKLKKELFPAGASDND